MAEGEHNRFLGMVAAWTPASNHLGAVLLPPHHPLLQGFRFLGLHTPSEAWIDSFPLGGRSAINAGLCTALLGILQSPTGWKGPDDKEGKKLEEFHTNLLHLLDRYGWQGPKSYLGQRQCPMAILGLFSPWFGLRVVDGAWEWCPGHPILCRWPALVCWPSLARWPYVPR